MFTIANCKKALSSKRNERGKKGGGSPSLVGKSKVSNAEKVEKNKRGRWSPLPITSKFKVPSFEIVEKG